MDKIDRKNYDSFGFNENLENEMKFCIKMPLIFILFTVVSVKAVSLIPSSVVEYANRLDREITENPHTAGQILRQYSFQDVVSIVRNDRSAARSWFLDPSFVPQLADSELVEFIAYSINHYFICVGHALRSVSLEAIDLYDSSSQQMLPMLSAPMSCSDILDFEHPEILKITERKVFDYVLAKHRMHIMAEGRSLLQTEYWTTPTYRDNRKYLLENHGGELSRDSIFEGLKDMQDMEVYRFHVMSLMLYVGLPKGQPQQPRLIFAAPLSV